MLANFSPFSQKNTRGKWRHVLETLKFPVVICYTHNLIRAEQGLFRPLLRVDRIAGMRALTRTEANLAKILHSVEDKKQIPRTQ